MAGFDFEFNFDHWRMLAEQDPAAFFAAREEVLARYIAAAPVRVSGDLHALQALVDYSRAEAGSPVRATGLILAMMGEHLAVLSSHMRDLRSRSAAIAGMQPPSRRDD